MKYLKMFLGKCSFPKKMKKLGICLIGFQWIRSTRTSECRIQMSRKCFRWRIEKRDLSIYPEKKYKLVFRPLNPDSFPAKEQLLDFAGDIEQWDGLDSCGRIRDTAIRSRLLQPSSEMPTKKHKLAIEKSSFFHKFRKKVDNSWRGLQKLS